MQRSISVDIAKGVAIIAIVLGHITYTYPQGSLVDARSLISLWHVPVFFLLGGFFIKEEKLIRPWTWFKKKFSSLYLRILYFYVPAVLLHNFFINIDWYSLQLTNPVIHAYSTVDYVKQLILTLFCAGREPILGAMWFVYVLFMALIGLSIVSWAINKMVSGSKDEHWIRFIVLLLFAIVSGILSNKYDLTIRRFSNVFTAMLLLETGRLMNQQWKLKFTNPYVAIVCLLLGFEVACMLGGVSLNDNKYSDIMQLIVAGPAILYCILFFGKRVENTAIGRGVAKIGCDSFYIMALHFVGFKVCTLTLHAAGVGGGYNAIRFNPVSI